LLLSAILTMVNPLLADRFLEITGTVQKNKMRAQYLDAMDIERERALRLK